MNLLEFLVNEIEPFRAEIEKTQTKTTAQYSKLAALRFIACIHGVRGYNHMSADELTRKLKSLL